jgi:hypothetical protein
MTDHTVTTPASDISRCGVCWRGKHYCDELAGHKGPCRCHCGVTLERQPLRLAEKRT